MQDLKAELAQLIGRELSSIEFVRDYVQLRFDGITFTVTNPLQVDDAYGSASFGSHGFCDRVCALIGVPVTDVHLIEDAALTVVFRNAATITVSLRPEDYTTPEAVVIHTSPSDVWVL